MHGTAGGDDKQRLAQALCSSRAAIFWGASMGATALVLVLLPYMLRISRADVANDSRFQSCETLTVKSEQVVGSQMDKQSISVGPKEKRGFPVTKRAQKPKPSHRKGAVEGEGKVARRKVTFVRDLIREVMGLAPYEKRVIGAMMLFFSCLLFPSMNVLLQSC